MLLQFSSRPTSQEDRCIGSSMVKSKTTCLPAVHPPRENTPQDRTGGSEGSCTHFTSMGKSVVVFSLLLESLADLPIILPETPALLHNPMGEPHSPVIRNHLRLAAWKVSGVKSKTWHREILFICLVKVGSLVQ